MEPISSLQGTSSWGGSAIPPEEITAGAPPPIIPESLPGQASQGGGDASPSSSTPPPTEDTFTPSAPQATAEPIIAESLPGQERSGLHTDVDPETGIRIRENLDGSRTLETPDGKVVVESEQHGSRVSETTYTRQDGAHVVEWEATHPNGDRQRDVQVRKESTLERTHTSSYRSPRNLQDLVEPETAALLSRDPGSDPRGPRNPTQITTTFRSVTYTDQQPPTEQVLESSTTYEQHIPLDKGEARVWEQALGTSLDHEQSGTHLSVTRSTHYDAQGNPGEVHEQAEVEHRFAGHTDEHGGQPSVSERTTHTLVDGKLRQTEATRATQHVAEEQALPVEYNKRVGYPAAQHRKTLLTRYDDEGHPSSEEIESFGDNLDDPGRDGRQVTRRAQGGTVTFHYAEVSEQGRHIDEQLSLQGSDTRLVRRTRALDNGGFMRSSVLRDDDGPPTYTSEERFEPIAAADVGGDPAYRDSFLERNQAGAIFRSTLTEHDSKRGEKRSVERYTSDSSAAELGRVTVRTQGGSTESHLLSDPESATPFRIRTDGVEAVSDATGALEIEGFGTLEADASSTAGSVRNVSKTLHSVNKNLGKIQAAGQGVGFKESPGSRGVGSILAAVDLYQGARGVWDAVPEGDLERAARSTGTTARSLGTLAESGGTALEAAGKATRLASQGKVAGKLLGRFGGGVAVGIGAWELSQRNTVDGLLSITGGAGGLVGGWVGGALVVAAASGTVLKDGFEQVHLPALEV